MSQLTIGEVLQDDQLFFEFVLNTPNQRMALELINGGIQVLARQLRKAVQVNDFHHQRVLNAKCKFLYQVATDRNAIYLEHEIVNAVEWIYGVCARKTLQERQSAVIEEAFTKLPEFYCSKSPLEQISWETRVLAAQPTWGPYRGKANTSIQCALAASRVPVLDLTLAMSEAFDCNRRRESWELCLQRQEARKESALLSHIAHRGNAYHISVLIYGRETAHEILNFANSHSSLPHFKKIQSSCRDSRYKGWLKYPSIREELESEFLERSDKEAA
ncbi:hypothetical protein ACYSUW_14285 [Pseudomonas frederiksbergensis]